MISSKPNYQPKTPSSDAITMGVRASTYEIGREHNLFNSLWKNKVPRKEIISSSIILIEDSV